MITAYSECALLRIIGSFSVGYGSSNLASLNPGFASYFGGAPSAGSWTEHSHFNLTGSIGLLLSYKNNPNGIKIELAGSKLSPLRSEFRLRAHPLVRVGWILGFKYKDGFKSERAKTQYLFFKSPS